MHTTERSRLYHLISILIFSTIFFLLCLFIFPKSRNCMQLRLVVMKNALIGLKPSLSVPVSHSSFPFSSSHSLTPFPLSLSSKSLPLLVFANSNKDLREQGNTQQPQPPNGSKDQQKQQQENGNDGSNQRLPLLGFNWRKLLDPDPDNVLALGLTGILTWASVQVLWQLLFISFAILVAALKYSFIAALLVFILIALL